MHIGFWSISMFSKFNLNWKENVRISNSTGIWNFSQHIDCELFMDSWKLGHCLELMMLPAQGRGSFLIEWKYPKNSNFFPGDTVKWTGFNFQSWLSPTYFLTRLSAKLKNPCFLSKLLMQERSFTSVISNSNQKLWMSLQECTFVIVTYYVKIYIKDTFCP